MPATKYQTQQRRTGSSEVLINRQTWLDRLDTLEQSEQWARESNFPGMAADYAEFADRIRKILQSYPEDQKDV